MKIKKLENNSKKLNLQIMKIVQEIIINKQFGLVLCVLKGEDVYLTVSSR